MTKQLSIGKGMALPLDAVTQTFGVLAKRGAGKTYTSLVMGEEMIGAGLCVAIVDPIGVAWGLRSSADGKSEGLPVVILGGDRGDVPLEHTAGSVIADWLIAERRPCVLDLSLFRKGEQTRFVQDFAERLYHKNRDPLHLMLDEADAFAPQRPMPGQQRMLGAVEDLVRRGRARGIGCTLITQRAAVLNKDVLTQVECLIALRTIGPQDRAAMDAWVKQHGSEDERRQFLESLASLPIGTAWVWSPGWLEVFRKVRVRRRHTFDSSATPKAGQRAAAPRKLAPVDLDALRGRIADTIERAKEEDPKHLRKRIAELERQLTQRESRIKRVEVPLMTDDHKRFLQDISDDILDLQQSLNLTQELVEEFRARTLNIVEHFEEVARLGAWADTRPKPKSPKPNGKGTSRLIPLEDNNGLSTAKLGRAARTILLALAQHGDMSLTQAAIIAGYSSKSGGVRNAAGELRTAGYIEGTNARMVATQAGVAALGEWDTLPTGRALAEHWYRKLSRAEREILKVVVNAHPGPVSLSDAAEACGYQPSSGGVRNAAGKLRTLDLVQGSNAAMTANEKLI